MTTEEKAKAYDEALEDMRVIYPNLKGDAKLAVEHAFPVLRESEDERIRKFLKDYAIEMIAGLESDISISVYDGVNGHDPDAEEELEKWREARAWLENQKEQKPAWSEEDERKRLACIETINEVIDYEMERWEDCNPGKPYRPIMKYDEQVDWLKSLRPVKQAWSKKDEDKLYQVMETLLADKTVALRENPHCKALHEAYDDMLAWLKSLRPSWKPNEDQMKALWDAYKGGKEQEPLRELIEQLKQL